MLHLRRAILSQPPTGLTPVLIVITGGAGLVIGQAAARWQVAPSLERLLSAQGGEPPN